MLQRVNPSLPPVNTRVTTFYSYKGGCGRTMALVNVATLLAAKGYKVLMMDWDLEAPGLPKYFRKYAGTELGQISGGLIDLLREANALPEMPYMQEDEATLETLFQKHLDQHVVSFTPQKPLKSRGVAVNHPLHLLPAGNTDDPTYSANVLNFNWDDFYNRIPGFFPLFSEYLQRKYDVVLIDSRTGISDAGGICTMLMPDTLVLVFTPNQQSYEGITNLARKAIAYRNASDDIRPLMVYPLPSRVELNEDQLRTEWETEYEESFLALMKELYDNHLPYNVANCLKTMKVRHASSYAYKEKIAALEEDIDSTTGLSVYFNIITDTIIYGEETEEFVYSIKEEKLKEEIQKNPSNYLAIQEYAEFLANTLKDLPRADEQYRIAIENSGDDTAVLNNYAVFLKYKKKNYIEAEKYFVKALEKNNNSFVILGNYANFLNVVKRYSEAESYYSRVLKIAPKYVNNLINYATFLKEIKKDYKAAETYYLQAIEIAPKHANAFGYYAVFLTDRKGDYIIAENYYLRAIELDSKNLDFLGNYAHFLLLQNRIEEGKAYIEKTFIALPEDSTLLSELWFYRFAHFPEYYEQAEQELRKLLAEGATTPGWNLQGHVDIARANGHPHIAALQEIAELLTKV